MLILDKQTVPAAMLPTPAPVVPAPAPAVPAPAPAVPATVGVNDELQVIKTEKVVNVEIWKYGNMYLCINKNIKIIG